MRNGDEVRYCAKPTCGLFDLLVHVLYCFGIGIAALYAAQAIT
jgi:hypothetical protein